MLTLLTATGCRPKAWALCELWMAAQDYDRAVRWVIVDDGEEAQPISFARAGWSLEVARPAPRWKPGMNSQARNLAAGLARIERDAYVVAIEDDDHYSPGYLSAVHGWLDRSELVGESHARYYNVAQRKGRQLINSRHASLCSTAMRGAALEQFRKECKPGVSFIDLNLWRNFHGTRGLYETKHVVGIKGLPGRGGIGIGHSKEFNGTHDPDGAMLRGWVGKDAELYL
ncbi:glycosyltransferase family A protein [Variovorax sp. RT4R15]|uniref:glycosyltransferase family A protein n=1 Tax=Variovorax sp. RT4R15 TaxID=3443737 RepID=UPI003F4607A6